MHSNNTVGKDETKFMERAPGLRETSLFVESSSSVKHGSKSADLAKSDGSKTYQYWSYSLIQVALSVQNLRVVHLCCNAFSIDRRNVGPCGMDTAYVYNADIRDFSEIETQLAFQSVRRANSNLTIYVVI